jgi:meso-butanediol dehydrogenase / (S,S)-butanediol dehydrogenase / diacetyl reductase
MKLENKTAVVTGSTHGVGAETARQFAAEGANVVVTGRSIERGEAVVAEIRRDGGRASFIQADLTSEEEVRKIFDFAVSEFGGVHILVNNASATDHVLGGAETRIFEQTTEQYDKIVTVGQYAVFWCCREAIPHMQRAGGGSIVNISSVAAWQGGPSLHAYSAVKGAMDAVTRQVAADIAEFGIRCNTVMLGAIHAGEHSEELEKNAVFAQALKSMNLFGRWGTTREAANAILFLASDASSFVTAACLPCDGGQVNMMFAPKFTDIVE